VLGSSVEDVKILSVGIESHEYGFACDDRFIRHAGTAAVFPAFEVAEFTRQGDFTAQVPKLFFLRAQHPEAACP